MFFIIFKGFRVRSLHKKALDCVNDGFYSDALDFYQKILEIDKEDYAAWNGKGIVLSNLDSEMKLWFVLILH